MSVNPLIKRALLSVSDKSGLVEFASKLNQLGIELIATGGTATLLENNKLPVTSVTHYTGFPEIMGGRVKTLHPKIYGGLLGRRGKDDALMQEHNIHGIDLLIVNLYPFAATIAKENCTLHEAIEQIDIGGPSMLRAAAKNHQDVTVVIDPHDYNSVIEAIEKQGNTSITLRQQLAQKVFKHTSEYDQTIANYLQKTNTAPETIYQPRFILEENLRYGENPHQQASFYRLAEQHSASLTSATRLQGKQLSYNNLIDADCALALVQSLQSDKAACVIVKHATPCAVAESHDLLSAYQKAYAADSESAFGGTLAINRCLDQTLAQALKKHFIEVIIAPEITEAAKQQLASRTNLRVLIVATATSNSPKQAMHHSVSGGLLVQERDQRVITAKELTLVTKRPVSEKEIADLLFAWQVVKFTKSNAIVFAKDGVTLGIGGGQTSRVFAAKIAVLRAQAAQLSLTNSVMASDAFFPFADSIDIAIANQVSAIIQPGGSKRDDEVIAAADKANIAMVFTGIRHFRH